MKSAPASSLAGQTFVEIFLHFDSLDMCLLVGPSHTALLYLEPFTFPTCAILCSDSSDATSQVPVNLRVANGTLAGWDSCGDQAGELERDAPSSCMIWTCMHICIQLHA